MNPTISIITCSFNPNLVIWKQSLDSIKSQSYRKDKIEHIVMDGGSNKNVLKLAEKYKLKVVNRPDLADASKSLIRMSDGIKKATGKIILILETDNILVGNNWLINMVKPFDDNEKIAGTFSMYNSFDNNMPLMTKYTSLIGINDPLVYYLDKSEKLPRYESYYNKGEIIQDNTVYTTVRFNKENFPTMGDNGHMIRRKLIISEASVSTKFLHTDAFYNLLIKGHDTYGVVKNSIIHYTGSEIAPFFRKRAMYKDQFYNVYKKRTYLVFNSHSKKDVWNLAKFIFFTITFVQPFYFSCKGFIKVREFAWFLHPLACLLAVYFYTKSETVRKI